jgi:hypothetical protein
MQRKPITLALILITATACTPQSGGAGLTQALEFADEMRQGCVAANLDVMLALADRFAPLCEARDLDELVALATDEFSSITLGDDQHHLECEGLPIGNDIVDLTAELEYLGANGEIGVAPEESVALRVRIAAVGLVTETFGEITCRPDPAEGLVLNGSIATTFLGGCRVSVDLIEVTAMRLADGPTGLVVTAGSIDITVDEEGVVVATGSAAIAGRTALIALEVDGFYSQGEILIGG